ncbi:MAG: hypothetical protein J6Q27_03415, partial [Clostridia bacterium]|nr:hypothetical protein [Clostridia bacterium]
VEGTSRNAFSPAENITERDAAEMIEKVLGTAPAVTSPFGAVQKTAFYANIQAALLADGADAAAIIAEVQAAEPSQVTESGAIRRADAAFILSEVAKRTDGIYNAEGKLTTALSEGDYTLCYSGKDKNPRVLVTLYRIGADGMQELLDVQVPTANANGDWEFTVTEPAGGLANCKLRVFLVDDTLKAQCSPFELTK